MIENGLEILGNEERLAFVEGLIASGLAAVNARQAVQDGLKIEGGVLRTGNHAIPLRPGYRLRLLAVGKAAVPMAAGAVDALGCELSDGLVITKEIPTEMNLEWAGKLRIMRGGHPIPTRESLESGQAVRDFLRNSREEDIILALISGGGSSLVQLPVAGVSLEDLQTLYRYLLRSGAAIQQVNTVRTHLDLLKGGGLLQMAAPARVVSLLISDVQGDAVDLIASGLTCPVSTTALMAVEVLIKHDLWDIASVSICEALQSNRKVQLLGNPEPLDEINEIILNNSTAVEAVLGFARQAGWEARNLNWVLFEEAKMTGKRLGMLLDHWRREEYKDRRICLVGGGETVVRVRGKGEGGRNLEVALAAVDQIAGIKNTALITLATDGEDGNTGVAGAVVSQRTQQIARRLGLSAQDFLKDNNSLQFFEAVGGLNRTGSTGTNVNDLVILLGW